MSEHEHEHGAPLAGVKHAFGHKIGPMPAGVWALGILGGILVAVFVRRNAAASDPADPTATDPIDTSWNPADPGGTTPGIGGDAGGTGDTAGDSDPGNGGPTSTPSHHHGEAWKAKHAKTNAAWRTHATAAMVGQGFTAGAVSATLGHYLTGEHLTTPESAIVGATLAICGAPPHPPKVKAPPHGGNHPGGPHPHHPHHPAPSTKDNGQHHPPVLVHPVAPHPHEHPQHPAHPSAPTKPPRKGKHHG